MSTIHHSNTQNRNNHTLYKKINNLTSLCTDLINAKTAKEKTILIDRYIENNHLFSCDSSKIILLQLSENEKLAFKAIYALEQGEIVFNLQNEMTNDIDMHQMKSTIALLSDVEEFYSFCGGIIGYYVTVLKLICEKTQDPNSTQKDENLTFSKPEGYLLDINANEESMDYIRWGIDGLTNIGMIFPVGGAGDRLDLKDEETGIALPAATLEFMGMTLLEHLFKDLEALEYLYFLHKGIQITIPVIIMTSMEKDNHQHILHIMEDNNWFGRPKNSLFFIKQPLVPVVSEDGNMIMKSQFSLMLKPGGHGMLWKLAQEKNAFNWLKTKNIEKIIVRQLNNPMASIDNGILSLIGIGVHYDKKFGFASCPRALNSAEGMIVLKEEKMKDYFRYSITNIEYTNFESMGIKDIPETDDRKHSKFPSNVNLLFADIKTIEDLIKTYPLPGLLVNMKHTVEAQTYDQEKQKLHAGRLESTMQNIADHIYSQKDTKIDEKEIFNLPVFVTYNSRNKAISVTKIGYKGKGSICETPLGSHYTLMENYRDLLSNYCLMSVPSKQTPEDYAEKGPNFIAWMHPAIGPLWIDIAKKINHGTLEKYAELSLNLVNVYIEQLQLSGSLLINADTPLGKSKADGSTAFNKSHGKCFLVNVNIINAGIDYHDKRNDYWKNKIYRKEALIINLHGCSECIAKNITITGSYTIDIPDGERAILLEDENGALKITREKILP